MLPAPIAHMEQGQKATVMAVMKKMMMRQPLIIMLHHMPLWLLLLQDYWYHVKNEHLLWSMAYSDRMGPYGLSGRRAVFFCVSM